MHSSGSDWTGYWQGIVGSQRIDAGKVMRRFDLLDFVDASIRITRLKSPSPTPWG